ncbi:MAG: MarR family transcriptional regulator [Thermoplasmata archaeon]
MMAPPLRDLAEVLRDGMAERDRVLTLLKDGPKTIPEIATDLARPTREVALWVMALRRYGDVVEVPKAPTDDYYRYRRAEATP